MSQTNEGNQPRTTQRDLIESGQHAIQESMELPVNQTVEFQRNLAKMFLTGLEMQDWAQRQALELMKTTFNNYLNTMESTTQGVSQATQATVQSAMESGQGPQPALTGEGAGQTGGSAIAPTSQQQSVAGREARVYEQPQSGQQPGQQLQGYGQPPAGQQFQGYGQPGTGQQLQGGRSPPSYGQQQTAQPGPGQGTSSGPPQSRGAQQAQIAGEPGGYGEPVGYEEAPENRSGDQPIETR